jgi:hypothetical protein
MITLLLKGMRRELRALTLQPPPPNEKKVSKRGEVGGKVELINNKQSRSR